MPPVRPASKPTAPRSNSATGVQMALVTIPSLEGEPIEDVANTIFRAWGVGQKGKNEGILLLLAIGDRRSRLEVGYGLEPILPDGLAGSILREMRPALRQQQYGEALMAAAETIGSTIAKAKGVTIERQLPRRVHRSLGGDSIPWPLVIGGSLLFLIFRRAARGGYGGGGGGGFLPGLILGNMMGRGRGAAAAAADSADTIPATASAASAAEIPAAAARPATGETMEHTDPTRGEAAEGLRRPPGLGGALRLGVTGDHQREVLRLQHPLRARRRSRRANWRERATSSAGGASRAARRRCC